MGSAGSGTGRLRRSDRLLHPKDFARLSRHGVTHRSRRFVMLVSSTPRGAPTGGPRLGITVSRRVGNAVVRNRVKRLVREWFRRERSSLGEGRDVVVIARPAAARSEAGDAVGELRDLARRAGDAGQ